MEENVFVYGADKKFEIIDFAYIYNAPCLLIKNIKEDEYSHLLPSMFNNWNPNFPSFVWGKIKEVEEMELLEGSNLHQVNDKINFYVLYKTKKFWVGRLLDNKNNTIYDTKINHFSKLNHGFFKTKQINLFKFTQIKEFNYLLKDKEIKESLDDFEFDFYNKITKGYPLIRTVNGVLRFKEEKLNELEKNINKDLNKAWVDYSKNKIKLKNMLDFYLKTNSSFGMFLDVFISFFL